MLLGVGCDIVEIVRIKRAMEKESFLRVLSEQERKLFDRIPKERRANGWQVALRLRRRLSKRCIRRNPMSFPLLKFLRMPLVLPHAISQVFR